MLYLKGVLDCNNGPVVVELGLGICTGTIAQRDDTD